MLIADRAPVACEPRNSWLDTKQAPSPLAGCPHPSWGDWAGCSRRPGRGPGDLGDCGGRLARCRFPGRWSQRRRSPSGGW